jgi:YidC/Oxa1 family membrane protein insertase
MLRSLHRPNYTLMLGGHYRPQGRRSFATSAGGSNSNSSTEKDFYGSDDVPNASGLSDVDATLERLFQENQLTEKAGAVSDLVAIGMEYVPVWYYPSDQCIKLILWFQEITGTELGMAIVGTTVAVRTILIPMVVMGQKSASRMAHLQPELELLKQKMGPQATPEDKIKIGKKVQALFKKYDVNPFRSMAMPFIQFPFFIGMFFGLKKMPDFFPQEMATGGMLWFPDLSQTAVLEWAGWMPVFDMSWTLPGICLVTMAASVELSSQQMIQSGGNTDMNRNMLQVFRLMMLPMVYILSTMHAGLLCYWTVNNVFTMVQLVVLKVPAVKKAAGIWDAPKPVPGAAPPSGLKDIFESYKKRAMGEPDSEAAKIIQHNLRVDQRKKQVELSRDSTANRRRTIKKR